MIENFRKRRINIVSELEYRKLTAERRLRRLLIKNKMMLQTRALNSVGAGLRVEDFETVVTGLQQEGFLTRGPSPVKGVPTLHLVTA